MRWRLLKLDLPYLFGELVIVVLGVLIALGANGWYENWRDRQTEEAYLSRILEELALGSEQLLSMQERIAAGRDAGDRLIELVESGSFSDEVIFEDYLYASMVGFTRSALQHDVTYRELVSTGNLNVISDDRLRVLISEYYRSVDAVSQVANGANSFTNSPNRSMMALTGKFPELFTRSDLDKGNDIAFSPGEKKRILDKLASNRDLVLEDTRSQLALQNLLIVGFLPSVIQLNGEVRDGIAQAL